MKPVAFAIDFGTTNSLIAAIFADSKHIELIPARQPKGINGSASPHLMPSSLYLDRTGQVQPGWSGLELFVNLASSTTQCKDCQFADLKVNKKWNESRLCKNTKSGGNCFDARLMSSVKEEIASEKIFRTHSWSRDFDTIKIVKEILLGLKRNAEKHLNLDEGAVTRVVIGHPVVFPNAEGAKSDELHTKALDVIRTAARMIGFREIQFVSEATAAGLVAQISQGKILALDFGAGTFDVSTAECRKGQTTILATHGSIVGGNKIDLDLFDRLVSQRMGLGSKYSGVSPSKGISNSIVSRLSSFNGFVRALHSRDIRGTVAVKKSDEGNEGLYEADALLSSGNGIDVYRAIQNAKAELSSSREVSMTYQLPGMSKTIIHFPIAVLDSVVDMHMPLIWEPIDQALRDSGWNDADVEFLLLTGGSSQLSRFRSLIQGRFNHGEIIEKDSFTSVVTGLAIWARKHWVAE